MKFAETVSLTAILVGAVLLLVAAVARVKTAGLPTLHQCELGVALLGVLHFGLSVLIWCMALCFAVWRAPALNAVPWQLLLPSIPALALLIAYSFCFAVVLRKRRFRHLLLGICLVASVLVFLLETHGQLAQVHSWVIGRGYRAWYVNWWWYSGRCPWLR